MKITFHGAARTVTGSKHLLQIGSGKKILMDCGMFQGMGKETLTLNTHFGFDPASVDYVVLSHAHIDHVGLLPKLVKEGYAGKIYCTPQTEEVAKLLLIDSAHIQEGDVKMVNRRKDKQGLPHVQPLYTEQDVLDMYDRFEPVPYGEYRKIDTDVELLYTDVGHIIGSAAVNLRIRDRGKTRTLTFSGDVGRYNDMILRKPSVFPQADYIIMESTYGDSLHEMSTMAADRVLQTIIDTCLKRGGKLIMPAFSLGRTQEILYILNQLEVEHRLPPVNYYVDSPLSIQMTELTKHHPECFNRDVQDLLKRDHDVFAFNNLHYSKTPDESKAITASHDHCVVISASGMAEAGRIKHHIAAAIEHPQNTILITGYCEPNSLGGKLRRGETEVTIWGQHYQVKANVEVIESLSAHGDYHDLSQWLSCQDPRHVSKLILVHGEYDTQVAFRDRVLKKGFRDIEIPDLHQEIGLG
jgi:metallo-beta-lactamase family protein